MKVHEERCRAELSALHTILVLGHYYCNIINWHQNKATLAH